MRASKRVSMVLSGLALVAMAAVAWGDDAPSQAVTVNGLPIVSRDALTQRVMVDGLRLYTGYGEASVSAGAMEITWEPVTTRNGERSWRYTLLLAATAACPGGCHQFMLQGSGVGEVTESAVAGAGQLLQTFHLVHLGTLTYGKGAFAVELALKPMASVPSVTGIAIRQA
jgi:hypothetical protein